MKRGRKPKSTERKVRTGNPGKRKIALKGSGPPLTLGLAPDGMTDVERRIWEDQQRTADAGDALTEADVPFARLTVEVLAQKEWLHGHIVAAQALLAQNVAARGNVVPFKRNRKGVWELADVGIHRALHDWQTQFRQYSETARKMLSELGRAGASSRSGLVAGKPKRGMDVEALKRAALVPRPALTVVNGGQSRTVAHGGA